VYYAVFQRSSTFSLTFSLLYSVLASRSGSSIFFPAAFAPAFILSPASFASSTNPDISKCIMHFIEDKDLSLLCFASEKAIGHKLSTAHNKKDLCFS
jgi:hypothetical protein